MELIDVIDEIVDTIVSEYKDCSKCGLSKLKQCFGKDKKTKDGLKFSCKDCKKASNAKYYQENIDEIAEQQAGYYQENKVAIAEQRSIHRAKPERSNSNALKNNSNTNKYINRSP